jgi:predicted NBD/HSP70 family sugar kinase
MQTDDPAEAGLDAASELLDKVLREAAIPRGDVIGVGLGLPGPIDVRSGRVGSSSTLPGVPGVLGPRAELLGTLALVLASDDATTSAG